MTVNTPDWVRDVPVSALDQKLGIEIVEWDPARLVATMPVTGNTRIDGTLHGGAVSSLVESVGSYAAAMALGPAARVVGVEFNASHHDHGATAGSVTAICRVQPADPASPLRSMLIEVHDDGGDLLTSARLTCMATAGRAAGQAGSSPA